MNKKALKEAALELSRVLVLAALAWGIAYLSNLPESQTTVIGLFVLKTIDKYLHTNDNVPVKGLLPF